MIHAIQLAKGGLYSTSPNPRVGCVLVRDGKLLAEGWHVRAGEGHAEVNALAALAASGETALGATAYVTLEPCSHQGKTPPCAEALVKAQVARVVVGMQDPNPLVAGKGLARLKGAGIDVVCGVQEAAARELNPGFIRRMEGGRPWLTVKSAMSLDGRTAMASGESQWITGPEARADVQRLRARSCAIVTGVETVLQDDAALTVRPHSFAEDTSGFWRQPLRVVLDTQLRTPLTATLLQGGGAVLISTVSQDQSKRQALQNAAAVPVDFIELPQIDSGLDMSALMDELAARGCNEVLIEAGAALVGSALAANLVDEWVVYMAPCVLGSAARPLANLPLQAMAEKRELNIVDVRAVGSDWRFTVKPKSANVEKD
ncbi:bifunctional diaminohydroxyphosphoribosylaminopyrimidine deaminase/5-amino-6-(5-phosphoribosylamino)uracil reductase RibD [Spongiibacter sp. KMU-158]|uniref:Riboflavin biosynthesis protein RibD n=2 Tax=Spongiibacter pelagi TaxID=2760804 RepID=A0A927C0W2_9GAMM|nr:bifunctional diaminohydroxyphosphoribosylaminopyrimidine deaminase/5-amino-6-(5-phosphoribosylamino)uracil reductase RibD [Spongiibacter pelagi]